MSSKEHDEDEGDELEEYKPGTVTLPDGKKFEGYLLKEPDSDTAWIVTREPVQVKP